MRNYSFSITKTYNVVILKTASRSEVGEVHQKLYEVLLELFGNPPGCCSAYLTSSELRVWESLKRFVTSERKGRHNNTPFVYVNLTTGKSAAFYVNGSLTVDVIEAFSKKIP